MDENQYTVGEWVDKTFGTISSPLRVAIRINQEMAELLTALALDDPKTDEEIADMQILLYQLANRRNIDLRAEVNKKMIVNRARQWNVDHTGCGQHK